MLAGNTLHCTPEYYVPTVAEVRERFASFIVADAIDLQPRYKNPDVDSMIATYCVSRSLAQVFSDLEQLTRSDWTIREKSPHRMRFDRYTSIGVVRRYETVEVRGAGPRCLTLAWLEADGVTPQTYADSSIRRWSEREFWPHVDQIAKETASKNTITTSR
jgi:hypothetical protein